MTVSAKQIAALLTDRFEKQFATPERGPFVSKGVYVDGNNWDPQEQAYWTRIHAWGDQPNWMVVVHVFKKKLEVQVTQSPGVPKDVLDFVSSNIGPKGPDDFEL
jgi:hypothetical protein